MFKSQTLFRTLAFCLALIFITSSYFFRNLGLFFGLNSHSYQTSTPDFSADTLVSEQEPNPLVLNRHGVAVSSQFPPYEQFDENAQANICFFLQLSQSSLPLAPRLVTRLSHSGNIILIHVDAKIPDAEKLKLKNKLRHHSVHFISSQPITYAGISMLLNILDAMEFALNLNRPWDYFIYLSGSDYPLISPKNLRIILGQPRVLKQQVSFVQLCCGDRFWNLLQKHRFDQIFVDPALGLPPTAAAAAASASMHGELKMTHKKNPMASALRAKFLHSSAFVTAHRTMVVQAARGVYGRRLLGLLSHMKDPEETFFAMLAWHTDLNRTLAHRAGRVVFWELNGVKSGQHPYWIDTDRERENKFWPVIARSKGLFVRKFKYPDSPLMNRIDAQISGVSADTAFTAQVRRTLKRQRNFVMCAADVERHWNKGTGSFYECL